MEAKERAQLQLERSPYLIVFLEAPATHGEIEHPPAERWGGALREDGTQASEAQLDMDESEASSLIEGVIRQRLEGIKLKEPQMIRDAVDVGSYSKFDDWPPGRLLQGEAALESEKAALAVLDEYRYTIGELLVNVKENLAWVSFNLEYTGAIRKRSFDVKSRVSMILAKSGPRWRIVHEHFSMLPQQYPLLAPPPQPREEKPKIVEPSEDELAPALLKILGDGKERAAAELAQEASKALGKDVTTPSAAEKCRELVAKGMLESRGRLYPKYRLRC